MMKNFNLISSVPDVQHLRFPGSRLFNISTANLQLVDKIIFIILQLILFLLIPLFHLLVNRLKVLHQMMILISFFRGEWLHNKDIVVAVAGLVFGSLLDRRQGGIIGRRLIMMILLMLLLRGNLLFFEAALGWRQSGWALLVLGEDPIHLLLLVFDFLVHVELAFDFAFDVREGGVCGLCKRGCVRVHWPFTSWVGLVLFWNNWSVSLLHYLHVNWFVYWCACTCCFLMGSITITTVAFHTLIVERFLLNPILLRAYATILGHSVHDKTIIVPRLSLGATQQLNIASSTHILLQLLEQAGLLIALILVYNWRICSRIESVLTWFLPRRYDLLPALSHRTFRLLGIKQAGWAQLSGITTIAALWID